jgi:hypothetical protein
MTSLAGEYLPEVTRQTPLTSHGRFEGGVAPGRG